MDKTNMVPVITMTNVSRLTTLQDLFAKESPNSGLSWISIQDSHGNWKKMGDTGLETSRAFSKLVENGPKSEKVRSFLNRRFTKDKSNVLGSVKRGVELQAKRTNVSPPSDSSAERPSKKRRTEVASFTLRTDKEGAELVNTVRAFVAFRAEAMLYKQRASDQIEALGGTLELESLITKAVRRQTRGPK